MNALAARRRHPAAIALLLVLGLVVVGGAYSLLAPKQAQATAASADDIASGKNLFLANCATCHGQGAVGTPAGPSLAGVGAASVDFQVGTGRMPLAAPGVQAQQNLEAHKFTQQQIDQMAAYVASLSPGPAIPSGQYTSANSADAGKGGELFRVNCAMCHNYAGSGGALTRGKYAPPVTGIDGKYIYEAMVTGPQSMPVFNDANISPADKQAIISYLNAQSNSTNVGGMTMGNLGPVSEGMFVWIFGLGLLIGLAVWLGKKAA